MKRGRLYSLVLQFPNLLSNGRMSCVRAGFKLRLQLRRDFLRPLKDSKDGRDLVLVAPVECDQAVLRRGRGRSGDVGNGRHRCVRGSGVSATSSGG